MSCSLEPSTESANMTDRSPICPHCTQDKARHSRAGNRCLRAKGVSKRKNTGGFLTQDIACEWPGRRICCRSPSPTWHLTWASSPRQVTPSVGGPRSKLTSITSAGDSVSGTAPRAYTSFPFIASVVSRTQRFQ